MSALQRQRPFVVEGLAGLDVTAKGEGEGCKTRYGRPSALMVAAAKVAKNLADEGLHSKDVLKVRVKNTFLELEEEEDDEKQFKRKDRTHKTDSAALWALRYPSVSDDEEDNGNTTQQGNDSDREANHTVRQNAVTKCAVSKQRPETEVGGCSRQSEPSNRSDSSESLDGPFVVSTTSEPTYASGRQIRQRSHSDAIDGDVVEPIRSEPVASSARARQHSGLKSPLAEMPSTSQGLPTDTTVMLRNLPNNYTRTLLLELIESFGLVGKFDFVYMPCDFESRAGLGYAFVNFVSHADAEKLRLNLNGFRQWCVPSSKVCSVGWSRPCQGLEANIKRYRNSSVMHDSVTDEFRPALFVNGQRVAFPPPTKNVKHPNTGNSARFKCRS